MKGRLTDKQLAAAKPPAKGQREFWDTLMPGLYLRVSHGGAKTWMVRFYRSGSRVREVLGTFPAMSVYDARVAGAAYVDTADAPEEERPKPLPKTFGDVCQRFVDGPFSNLAASTQREWGRLISTEVMPRLGALDANDSRAFRASIRDLVQRIAKRSPYTSNRVYEVVRRIFNWGVGQDLVVPAPVFMGLERAGLEKKRERVLTDDELRAVLNAALLDYPEWRAYWALLFYTGARRGTVLGATWDQFDFDKSIWLVPSEIVKGRPGSTRATVVPIVPQLKKALEFQKEITGRYERVIANLKTADAISNPQKAANRVRALSGVQDWHVHDIRHTVSTNLGRLGVLPHIIDRVMMHTSGSRVHRIYNQWEYLDEKRAALEKWAAHLGSLKVPQKSPTRVAS
jgi:integrase